MITGTQMRAARALLGDFAIVGVTPLLLVFPAAWLVLGSLSRTGAHAVFLALTWFALMAASGRSPLPFHVAFVPALPFLCLAVQEGMIAALDGVAVGGRRRGDFGPVSALLQQRYWALHDDPGFVDPVLGLTV